MQAQEFFQQQLAPPQGYSDAKVAGDHFMVEDLLDFSNDDVDADITDQTFDAIATGGSTESSTVTAVDSCNSNSSSSGPEFQLVTDFGNTQFFGDLSVPCDDWAELEWLSNFVEASFSSEDLEKLHQISGVKAQPVDQGSEARGSQPETVQEAHTFRPELPVPGKARSKRSRAAPGTWNSRLLLLSPTSATVSSSAKSAASGGYGRRCVHCTADKTPQWRSGPTGPKTLCNACGVRYKSGRLVPEYRPAASPTFTLTRHSNSHRKVLELRRQKEMIGPHHRPPFVHPNVIFDQVTSGEDYLIHQHVGPDFRQLI